MLPIAWFAIVATVLLWILLLYTELRNRAGRHVKGCPSLSYISPQRLNSLIIIEPDLEIVELCVPSGASIPDARPVPADQLERFVSHTSRSKVIVFYDSAKAPANWRQVEVLVGKYMLRNTYVLKGGREAWESDQRAHQLVEVSSSPHTAKLA
jgi:hypothetical protein